MSSLARIRRRHGSSLLSSVAKEAFVRAYQRSWARAVLRLPFRRREPSGWIFMGGSYNAGTTIVKNALMAHPDVNGMPVEGDILTHAFQDLERGGYPRGMYANRDLIERERAESTLDASRIRRDWSPWVREHRHFLDKAIANTVRIPLLRQAFPGAKFVGVVRHPEDVARGIKKRSQPAQGGPYSDQFLNDQWSFFYRTLLNDAREDTALCSYESFISAPKDELERLFDFLGLRSIPVEFDGETLQVGGQALAIRPLPQERPRYPDARSQILAQLEALDQQGVNQ